ncbi:type VI secretion system accessory protein TagJ [Burkholderia oklahomensis]|uniref:ImpE family protein n=1 Tax=Burkholderia oklahomensis TaxID=342113 RepID=A0AAI8BAB1_9BURK|nr:type VI secretion system accessory protein TagJ [Burkholderia oklahomensis]AIO68576.1 impE family protein [Burkholderia oklahomensis]AOI39567.1 ImpE/SciE family protein [Burkholderia oklahomensis EO147]KUY51498.1 ImpE/SciE family protein [Burkholderia oklahomensis EO147]QPS40080.1 ImpE/SciE family protein [Burkholderia oklahomensis]
MTMPIPSDSLSAAEAGSSRDLPLEARLASMETTVRAQPAVAEHRWSLFQLLCVTGQWARAVQQLQVHAQLAPQQAQAAQAYRDLVRAERWRARVAAGQARPGFVFEAPQWIDDLLEALRVASIGRHDEADRVRERALDQAPLVAGRMPPALFDWIADSDSRFGPVCEIVTAGHYRWLPFSEISAWHVARPAKLLDLVWAPCALKLVDGSLVRGFMPARYPGSEAGQAGVEPCAPQAVDALRLGRRTVWREVGRTGVIALGRKTWSTSAGDFGLFELEACEFGERALAPDASGTATHEPAREGDTDERA